MFDRYVNQDDNDRRRRWLSIAIAGSVIAHLGAIIAVTVAGMWKVDKVHYRGDDSNILVRAMHAGVAAPPPLGKPHATKQKKLVVRKRMVRFAQPTRQVAPRITVDNGTAGDGVGRADGKTGGTGDDPNASVTSLTACKAGELCGNGLPTLPTIQPPKQQLCPGTNTPPPCRPAVVSAHVIAGSRLSGNKNIQPPDQVKAAIANQPERQVIGAVLMCLDKTGRVSSVKRLRSTGYPAYDRKIAREIRQWRYAPYRVNGTAVPVCTSITLVFKLR